MTTFLQNDDWGVGPNGYRTGTGRSRLEARSGMNTQVETKERDVVLVEDAS